MAEATVPRATKQQQQAMVIYRQLLDEARSRLIGLEDALGGRLLLPAPLITDFGYLQLRMLCEIVALCCLNAHGDIEGTNTSRLQKAYEADKLMKMLAELHPNFYPHPVVVSSTENSHHLERIQEDFLRKEDLVQLYHECGGRLHKGSLAKFRSSAPRAHQADHEAIRTWHKKFATLLAVHHVASYNSLSHYLCFLSHESRNGEALVVLAKAPEA